MFKKQSDSTIKLLFVGESWLGSDARTLKEAMKRIAGAKIDEVNEDLFYPHTETRKLRAMMRVLGPLFRRELFEQVRKQVKLMRPDVVFIVKGTHFSAAQIDELKALGPRLVLRFPDACPLAHGERLKRAAGHYDLVISAKPLHPSLWHETYGYSNRCICVPHGYSPELHLQGSLPDKPPHAVVMVASGRPEYEGLLEALARSKETAALDIVIGGNRWMQSRARFPRHWKFVGPVTGEAYVNVLRSGKIVIAPITTRIVVDGMELAADVDTARTYELAAAGCFFIHRRSDYVATIYDELTEVPLFDNADDLVGKVIEYLPQEQNRRCMAEAAHRRAVPHYSIDARADQILEYLQALL